jgi:hypothetical protein
MMSIFQILANWIKRWKFPESVNTFLQTLLDSVLIPALYGIGKDGLDFIIACILEQANNDLTGDEKFKNVFSACKKYFDDLPTNLLNTLINSTYSLLKAKHKV